MQKRRLGQTGIDVSILGLGTVKFGRTQGVNYPAPFKLPSDVAAKNLLHYARDLGINLLDTAPAYGVSEARLGNLLKNERHHWIITTKVGEEFSDQGSHFDFSPAAIQMSIDRSLERLATDYLDLVLVHSNGDDLRIIHEDQVFATLAQLKSIGKIRSYGMSTKTVAGGLLTVDHADVAMVTFNPQHLKELPVVHEAQRQKKGILIKKALASGRLSFAESVKIIFKEPGVTSVIVGTINPIHLKENVLSIRNLE